MVTKRNKGKCLNANSGQEAEVGETQRNPYIAFKRNQIPKLNLLNFISQKNFANKILEGNRQMAYN